MPETKWCITEKVIKYKICSCFRDTPGEYLVFPVLKITYRGVQKSHAVVHFSQMVNCKKLQIIENFLLGREHKENI
jgi:hypothetical protein